MSVKTAEILSVPLPPEGLTANRYLEIKRALEEWEEQVRENASRFPSESYSLGVQQAIAFLNMLGRTGQTDLPPHVRWGPSQQHAVDWQQRYTLHEIDDALHKYRDRIESALLYGLRGNVNPTQLASWLYHATKDAQVNWRTIARTEMVRANAAGRLNALEAMGYTEVWAPRHAGACKKCRTLLEDRVFKISEVRDVTNFGLPAAEWRACIPLHPNCRHVWVAHIPEVFEEAQEQYRALEDNGLDDRTLAEMFSESGQVKPQYANDPRLMNYFEATGQVGKVTDPLGYALNLAVVKAARREPPGLHHTSLERRQCRNCDFFAGRECGRYNWPVDRTEVCASWEPAHVGKSFFDNGQAGLDPLLFNPKEELRADVRDRLVRWWRLALGRDAPLWSRLYVTGSATSRAWEGRRTAGDVDVQVVVDYPALREHQSRYRVLSDPELHAALVTRLRAAADGAEAAPGLALEPFLRPETTWQQFEADVADKAQGVWAVNTGRWLVPPPRVPNVEAADGYGGLLEGEGAELALKHPEWVAEARLLNEALDAAMRDPDEHRAELQRLFDVLHAAREAAFAPGGVGALDRGNFLWRWCMDFGQLARVKHFLNGTPMEKVYPGFTVSGELVAKAVPLAPGTQHWITVHPGGDDSKGVPVLIRENGDGSATVIGGAGGHLDFLRISPKGRMKSDKPAKPGQAPEQYDSPEEAQAAAAKHEEAARKAEEVKARAQDAWHDSQARIESLVKDVVDKAGVLVEGQQVGWDDLSGADRKKLIRQATEDSLFQTSYSSVLDRKRADAPVGPIPLGPQPGDNPDPSPSANEPNTEPREESDTPAADPPEQNIVAPAATRIRVPVPTDVADLLQEELAASAHARRGVIEANRVLNRRGKPVDASDVAWEPLEADRQTAAQKRGLLKARELVNNELLDRTDKARKEESGAIFGAIQQGAYDAYDSLLYHATGSTRLPRDMSDLLGVSGTAQLAAYMLQQHAARGETSLDGLRDVIDEVTDDRQQHVTNVGLNRARHAVAQIEALTAEERNIIGGGDSLTTRTSIIASRFQRGAEAAKALGFAIAGSEALHTLREQLHRPVTDVHVSGFVTPAQAKARGAKVRIDIQDKWIVRNGPGDYTLKIPAADIAGLLERAAPPRDALKEQLAKIRTGQDLDNEIAAAQHPPGYTRELRKVQAQGSLFLRAAKGAVLGFAPGVGKTDTAIAAAMELMHTNPGHRVLIVCPTTAMAGAWAPTIQKVAPGKTLQILGQSGPASGEEGAFDWKGDSKSISRERRAKQVQAGADFNIISVDTLKTNPDIVKGLGHTIVIADELQYAKTDTTQRMAGLKKAAEGCEYRWGLTGTPMEKNVGEYHTMLDWARPGDQGSKQQFTDRYATINQFDTLSGPERVQQFRDATGYGVFFQSQNASGMPPFPEMQHAHAPITEGHADHIRAVTREFNDTDAEARAARAHNKQVNEAIKRGDSDPGEYVPVPKNMGFGGRAAIKAALMNPEARGYQGPNGRAQKVADLVGENQPIKFDGYRNMPGFEDGQHAGVYAPKSVVFNKEVQPLESVRQELERRGTHKVFTTRGGDPVKNQQVLQAFMAHKGPAVLLTSDTNKTAVSLQFGTNSGQFQRGATQVIHTDLPENNADLEQRVARIWRDGAQAPVSQHWITSGTPLEQRTWDNLVREQRSLQALGNAEDMVGGKETIGQKVRRRGLRRTAAPTQEARDE